MSEFKTTSLDIASYLMALGYPEPSCNLGRRCCTFRFDDPTGEVEWNSQELEVTDLDRANQVAIISAVKLFKAQRRLRDMMDVARGISRSFGRR